LGHYAFVLDVLTIGQDIVETLGVYILVFIVINALSFYRNYVFIFFNKFYFKNHLINKNILIFSDYFSLFFVKLNKAFLYF